MRKGKEEEKVAKQLSSGCQLEEPRKGSCSCNPKKGVREKCEVGKKKGKKVSGW